MGYRSRLFVLLITLVYESTPTRGSPGVGIVCPGSQKLNKSACGLEGDTCGPGAPSQCCDCLWCVELSTAWVCQ
ncbi:hypothetical protein FB451DRAFT_290559 [Mycena latifolia]|nr:hypothetical protein FB451DRAFT_290559 [Mycena latifolia]